MISLHVVECVDNRRVDADGIESLAESIGNNGLLQPLILQEIDPTPEGYVYRVLDGRRRYRALVKLERFDLSDDDYRVLDTDDPEMVAYVANFCRENFTPGEEADHLAMLRKKYSPAEIAGLIGKSEKFVRQRLSLSLLCPELREAMDQNLYASMKIGHYVVLTGYSFSVQRKAIDSWFFDDDYTIREFSRCMEDKFGCRIADAPFDVGSCKDCLKRSDAQRLLFEDLASDDQPICQDRECFESKRREAVQNKVEALTAERPEIRIVAENPTAARLAGSSTETLVAGEFDVVERDVPVEEANAFVIDGAGAGTYCRIADPKKCAEAEPPKGKSLEERRAILQKRRHKRAAEFFANDLCSGLPYPGDAVFVPLLSVLGLRRPDYLLIQTYLNP